MVFSRSVEVLGLEGREGQLDMGKGGKGGGGGEGERREEKGRKRGEGELSYELKFLLTY